MSDMTPAAETPAQESGDTTETPPAEETSPEDLKAQLEKIQKESRKWEERAKANSAAAKELEQAKLAALSDTEKAVELAKQQARAEAFAQLGGQLVDMAVKAAVAGRNIDAEALLDGLDRARFLTEDGLVDEKALTDWVERIAPKSDTPAGFPDLGQGARTNGAMALNGDPLLRSVLSKLKS